MAIEDLPVIKEEDITNQTPVVEKAEICYNWLPPPNEDFVYIAELFFVLGRSENNDVFVADQIGDYPNLGKIILVSDSSRKNYLKISRIKSYTSLIEGPDSERANKTLD